MTALAADRKRPMRLFQNLARTLRELKPALVQSFLFHANIASRWAAWHTRLPHHIGGIRVAEPRRSHLILERVTQQLGHGSVCVSEAVRQHMITKARIRPERLVVIGDTPHDVHCGKAVGARTLAVASGAYTVADLQATAPWQVMSELPEPEAFAALVA